MDAHHDSLTRRALRKLADAVLHRPRWFFWPQILLAIACVIYTVRNLEFSTSRNALVSDQLHYHRLFLEFRKEFAAEDDIVVIVESETPEKNRQFIERLGARVELETNLFTDVFFRGDLPMLGTKALQFLDPAQLTELQRTLREYRPFLDRITTTTNLESLFQLINRQFRVAQRATEDEQETLVGALPALERIVRQATDSIQRPGTPPSPGVNALFGGGPEAERKVYLTFLNGRLFLLSLRPPHRDVTGDAIVRLRELIQRTRLEVPGVNADITGGSVLEREEMLQSQDDTLLATGVSLVLVALIFIFGYQETGRPLKAMFCLLIGLCYSMGYTTATVGRLNILTITFAPMLVGMAVDFGVHLITRYEEELRHGLIRQLALRKAMINTGEGIFTGALTTAGAFFAMAFTDFAGVSEMGIITGGGLLVSLIPMMTMLPVMLLKGRQNAIDRGHPEPGTSFRERLELAWIRRAGTVLVASFAFAALCATQFQKVYFDYDLRNLQSKGLPAVEYEKKLMNSTPRSVLFGAVVASNAADAVTLRARLTNLTSVADVDSIASLLIADPSGKLQTIGAISADLAPLRLPDPPEAPPKIPDLSQTLWSLQGYLGQAVEAVRRTTNQANLEKQLLSLRAAIGELRSVMNAGDRARATRKLAAFESAFFEDLRDTFETLKSQDHSAPLRIQDLPDPIRNRFVGKTGKLLLQVYPNVDVWIRTNQAKFIGELRGVVPDVTGDPVQLYEYTNLLKESYEEAGWYALAAMAALVLVQFRSPVAVVLSLVPVAFGGIWLLGFMGWFGIPFNPANIMTLPLVVGIGVTYGVHILTRFAEEQDPAILAKSTGKAVLVSGLTTVAGFGSLVLAKHQGIVSLGFVMAVGITTASIAGLVTLPALLVVFRRYAPAFRVQKKTQRH